VFGRPAHPYTKMLLASVPQLHERWDGSGAAADLAVAQAAERASAGGALVEVEDDHFVAS